MVCVAASAQRPSPSRGGRYVCLLFLYQEAGGVYGINGGTASHEAALIAGKLDDVTNSSVDNSLKDLHAERKQANRTVIGAVCRTPFFFQIGIVALWRQYSGTFFSASLIEELRQSLSIVPKL
ncbi:unnamed protein product [Heligmosomoides polygyrus]|uniref:Uncharacterized protein n=1 Tax=Heligmosomoides polygyrus TaxID=6339 RepID=A0A183F5A7_HELPZ|nr:unnamed protein product [Heligmosomoides polygyrus]